MGGEPPILLSGNIPCGLLRDFFVIFSIIVKRTMGKELRRTAIMLRSKADLFHPAKIAAIASLRLP